MKNEDLRISRERRTVEFMIRLYCRKNHSSGNELCGSCSTLLDHSNERLSNCSYGVKKPTCSDCEIHCYKEPQRSEIRKVMRFSGPRMIFYHPILAVMHLLDKLRKPTTR